MIFLCLIPVILVGLYLDPPIRSDLFIFLATLFYYAIIIIGTAMAAFLFIPPIIFRVFHIMPREGEFDLTVYNKEVFKWLLSLGLYKISMIFGRISPITRYLVLLLFAAKLGKDVYFQGEVTEPYFLEVGDGTVVGDKAKIFTHIADKPGKVLFRRVRIGKNCLLGYAAIIMPGAVLKDNVILGAYSIVPKNRIITGGVWVGIPAKKIKENDYVQRENSK